MIIIVDITTNRIGTTAVVTPHGDLDVVTCPELRAAAHDAIEEGAEAMVIDLSDCGFLDSTAIGVLVSVHHRLRDRLVVAAARPNVIRLLDITRLTTVLRLCKSVDDALVTLKG